jgi:glycosyltransferase involved in cell wall biosynthesis
MLILVPATIRGGNEEYALTIGSAAVDRGYAVWAAFPQRDDMLSVREDFLRSGVKCVDVDISEEWNRPRLGTLGDIRRLVRILPTLLRIRPHVAHLALSSPIYGFALLVGCAMLRIPALAVFQFVPYRVFIPSWKQAIYRWTRRRQQQWVAISRNNQQLLCDSYHLAASDVLVIYNGARRVVAETGDDMDRASARRDVRLELGVPPTARLLVTVGRLNPQKGHVDLIKVVPDLLKSHPDVRFVWVGDGPQREEFGQALRRSGADAAVHMLGYRRDVPRLLQAADLFVFPTRAEGGQSFALAEAMAARLPIVSSSASGIPEVIEHRVHGLLFPPGNPGQLLEAVRWALENPTAMKDMAEAAFARAAEFTEERMVEETFSLVERLRRR